MPYCKTLRLRLNPGTTTWWGKPHGFPQPMPTKTLLLWLALFATFLTLDYRLDHADRFLDPARVQRIAITQKDSAITLERGNGGWTGDGKLVRPGRAEQMLDILRARGYLYQQNGALWFRASDFGDEKDRVVKRENGITTYFASDIAYHYDKYQRGYDRMIDIFGADHHGYMARVRASLAALGLDPEKLDITLVQFAVLYQNGEKIQMSTRSGQFVTLRDLRAQVGSDAARFFYVMRKPEQHLDFDLDLAVSHSKDNPYYYVQYAHARTSRVLERAREENINFDPTAALAAREHLTEPEEKALLRELARYPDTIAAAGNQMAGHLIVNYLKDLAGAWHQYYDAGHKVLHDDAALRDARLLLTHAVRQVLRNGLNIIGVAARERM